MQRATLGVNVDHVATLRQARGTQYPDPVHAAVLAENAGADQITVHLRGDRRHIQERDVRLLRHSVGTRLNLEMGATAEMLEFAKNVRPDMVTLVPERREERTTEGGLDLQERRQPLAQYLDELRDCGANISLFIDPDNRQVKTAADMNVELVEIHTGDYCEASPKFTNRQDAEGDRHVELEQVADAARHADELGLDVAAGHGLTVDTVEPVAAIPQIEEFNVGHSIVSRAVFVGFEEAVREVAEAIRRGRRRS